MLEAALFMRGCDARFSADARSVRLSFVLPFLILPLSVVTLLLGHPDASISGASMRILALLYTVRFVLYLAGFAAVSFMVSKILGQSRERFMMLVCAHNFLVIPPFLLSLPLIAGFLSGIYGWAEIYPLMVVITLYGFACTGYAAMRVFRLPLELGAAFAVGALALHQGSLSVLKFVFAQGVLLFA